MKKSKTYDNTKFPPEVIREACRLFIKHTTLAQKYRHEVFRITFPKEEWTYNKEEEFFADYRKDFRDAWFERGFFKPKSVGHISQTFRVTVAMKWGLRQSMVDVELNQRHQIEEVFNFLETKLKNSKVKRSPGPIIFIGHGRNPQWKELKDYLQDKQGYRVEAYEKEARDGKAINDILAEMLKGASLGVLVMTGEDKTSGATLRARDNVIHELGLSQQAFGLEKTIVLLEDGTREFSNIRGIHQTRFKRGRIKEAFADVMAVLTREF
jgi:hypothetical protein